MSEWRRAGGDARFSGVCRDSSMLVTPDSDDRRRAPHSAAWPWPWWDVRRRLVRRLLSKRGFRRPPAALLMAVVVEAVEEEEKEEEEAGKG